MPKLSIEIVVNFDKGEDGDAFEERLDTRMEEAKDRAMADFFNFNEGSFIGTEIFPEEEEEDEEPPEPKGNPEEDDEEGEEEDDDSPVPSVPPPFGDAFKNFLDFVESIGIRPFDAQINYAEKEPVYAARN